MSGPDNPDGLAFATPERPIFVHGGALIAEELAVLLPGWPPRRCRVDASHADIVVTRCDGRLHVAGAATPPRALRRRFTAAAVVANGLVSKLVTASPRRMSLHAAAFATGDGEAVVLAGRGQSAKSTLAMLLAQSGRRVLADDVVMIEVSDDGRISVAGAGQALKLRTPLIDPVVQLAGPLLEAAVPAGAKRYVPLPPDRTSPFAQFMPVRAVVLLSREERSLAVGPNLSAMGQADAIKRLLGLVYAPHVDKGAVLTRLARLVRAASVQELRFADSAAAAAELDRRFS